VSPKLEDFTQTASVLEAGFGAHSHQASIGPSFSGATFIQLWRMHSVEEQLGLLYSGNHHDLFRTASDTARRAQILGPRRWAFAFGMQTELTECLSGLLSPTESETSRMAMLSPVTI
jgi:hypothetical protein